MECTTANHAASARDDGESEEHQQDNAERRTDVDTLIGLVTDVCVMCVLFNLLLLHYDVVQR